MARLNDYFDQVFVINLPERSDRRKDMERELRKVDLKATFFPAVKVTDLCDWPSLGARGCFLSHYNILKQALASGARNVLIVEDDLDFSPQLKAVEEEVVSRVSSSDWGFFYPGHVVPQATLFSPSFDIVPWTEPLQTTHFMAVNGPAIPRVVEFLEQVLSRPNGHPLGGPQHVDGAYSMFRAQNPDVLTLLCVPALGSQRSSRSDVSGSRYESIPVLRQLLSVARRIKRKLK